MTISLDEHVARAICPDADYWDNGLSEEFKAKWLKRARAAIAAVREREGDAAESKPNCQRDDYPDDACIWPRCVISCPGRHFPPRVAPDPAEAMRIKTLDECEEIARNLYIIKGDKAWKIADAIAALKDNGERREPLIIGQPSTGFAPMTAEKEPIVEKIVRAYETAKALGLPQNYIGREYADALISDWRRRGEERDSARALLRECDLQLEYIDGRWPTGTTPTIRARIDKELGPTSEDEPHSPRAS